MSRRIFYRTRAGDAADRIAARLAQVPNMARLAEEAGVNPRTACSWKEPERLKQVKEVLALLFAAGMTGEELITLIGGAK